MGGKGGGGGAAGAVAAPTVSPLAAMFPPAQRPFVMLLEYCDSHTLNAQVRTQRRCRTIYLNRTPGLGCCDVTSIVP